MEFTYIKYPSCPGCGIIVTMFPSNKQCSEPVWIIYINIKTHFIGNWKSIRKLHIQCTTIAINLFTVFIVIEFTDLIYLSYLLYCYFITHYLDFRWNMQNLYVYFGLLTNQTSPSIQWTISYYNQIKNICWGHYGCIQTQIW